MNHETPPASPEPAQGKVKPAAPAPRASRPLLTVVVLGLAAAVAGGGYLGMRAEENFSARLATLQSALDAQLAAEAESRTRLASNVGAAQSTAERARSANAALDGRLDALETRLDTLAGKLATLPRSDADALANLALAEARALVGLAEQRLLLARDTAGAIAALNLANARLPSPNTALAIAIAHDLAALAAFKDADLVGLAAELGALASASHGWGEAVSAAPAGSDTGPATPAAPAPAGWQGFLLAVWHDLRALVEIRDAGTGADPLLAPLSASLSRQRFTLALEAARLAVLGRNTGARDASVEAATSALRSGFEAGQAEVRQVATRLQQITTLDLAPPLPALASPGAVNLGRTP